MGNLVRMSHSEITATLEALDREGVLPEHLAMLRKNKILRKQVAKLIKGEIFVPELLSPVTTIKVSSFMGDSYAAGDISAVRLAWIDDNFKRRLLSKKAVPQGEVGLRVSKLKKASRIRPILDELGGEKEAETALINVWVLLKRQPDGRTGVFRTDGYANIFYVRGINGFLWAVIVRWHRPGWELYAKSVADPDVLNAGCQVFSPYRTEA